MVAIDDADAAVAWVGERLDARSDLRRRTWWERYLKGQARFRGAAMADIRRVVAELVERRPIRSADDALRLAEALMACPLTEDKLAGVLLLAEHARPLLTIESLDRLAEPLANGSLSDWNSVDWYSVKVVGPFVFDGPDTRRRARGVAAWSRAEGLWQRRAAAVAFTAKAPDPPPFVGFDGMLLGVCARLAKDRTRWSQTSAGWLLRELSKRVPETVRGFVDKHPTVSAEARRMALAKIEPAGARRR